jgi:DNA-binding response OmpR family regulator
MEEQAIRLAVMDTDSGFVRVLTKRLEGLGWSFRVLPTPPRPEDLVAMRLNAIVMDVSRIGADAWDYLDRVCSLLPNIGVIICAPPATVAQRVGALRLGADDWLAKPCHPEELIARIEAVVRRGRRAAVRLDRSPLRFDGLEIRMAQFQVFAGERDAGLTRREFEVLHLLAEAEGEVVERERIYQHVWGYAMARGDRSVDVFVRKVRQKLEAISPDWQYIHTHVGVGYRFEPTPPAAPAGTQAPEPQPSFTESLPQP